MLNGPSKKYVPCKSEDYVKAVKRIMADKKFETLTELCAFLQMPLFNMKRGLGNFVTEFKE